MDQGARLAAELTEAFGLENVDRLAAMVRVREQLDAQIAVETAAFDGQAAFEGRGYRSPASYLVDDCRISRRSAAAYLSAGRAMKAFPLLTEAAQNGDITFDHVKAFARTVVPPRADEERVALASSSEHKFLAKAKAYTSDDFGRLCRAWRLEADFHDPEARKRIIDKTEVVLIDHQEDDYAELRIGGPRVDVLAIHKAITRESDRLWREENGETDDNVAPLRHKKERRFRAVLLMAKRAMARFADDLVLPEPLLNLQMDWDTYDRESAAYAAGHSGPGPDEVFKPGFISQTIDGKPISPSHMFAISLRARIRRVVFDAKSRKVDLGRSQRLYTSAAREAVMQRDKHCQHPGCDMPGDWCDVDHILEWQHGGHTNPENGQLLCRWHHTRKKAA